MKSPAEMKIIQIDVTNACPHRCSNCTRFTGLVTSPFFMDFETFRRAVTSLEQFPRMVGVMGGEPTLHPEFERFVEFYAEHVPGCVDDARCAPIADFARYRQSRLSSLRHRRGLWTSLGPSYYKHYELIQDTFPYQCINDHSDPSIHQALLVTRRDLGVPDDEWVKLRDACWIQNKWSASITPKGAFFCEVAGALDMLYGGPGGWSIEPGWWKRTPRDFGKQLEWCELCSAPLQVPRLPSDAERDVVSPWHEQVLTNIGSPGVGRLLPVASLPPDETTPSAEWYLPPGGNLLRVSSTNSTVHPRRLDGVCVCVGFGDVLQYTLPTNVAQFDRFVVVTSSTDVTTQSVVKACGAELVVSDRYKEGGDSFNKGKMLNEGWRALAPTGWVLLTDADIFLPSTLREYVLSHVLNPGCMYFARRVWLRSHEQVRAYSVGQSRVLLRGFSDEGTNCQSWGYFQLVHPRAKALAGAGDAPFSEAFCAAGSVDGNFRLRWPSHKRVRLSTDPAMDVVHVPHAARFAADWNGRGACLHGGVGWRWAGQLAVGRGVVLRLPNSGGYVRLTRADTAESVIGRHDQFVYKVVAGRWRVGFHGYGYDVVDRRGVMLWRGQVVEKVGVEIAWKSELRGDEPGDRVC